MIKKILTLVVFFMLISTRISYAFWCYEPYFDAIQPYVPTSRPDLPYCYTYGECESWEIQNYFDEVNAYIDDLRRYAEELGQFRDDVNLFLGDAIDYAYCEAESVKTQHE